MVHFPILASFYKFCKIQKEVWKILKLQRKISYHIPPFRFIFSCDNLNYTSAVLRWTKYFMKHLSLNR